MVRSVLLNHATVSGLGLLLAWIALPQTIFPQVHAAPAVLWVPVTAHDCKATCKAYRSTQQPLVTYTQVTAGSASSLEGLLAICGLDLATPADTWLPGKKLPANDDPACYYFNATSGDTAKQESGFSCLCAPGASPTTPIVNWVASNKRCGAGSAKYPPTIYSICRGSASSGDFYMIPGYLHPNSNRCSTGMGETDAYELLCLKANRVSCYGKPKMLVQKANPWPISCDGTIVNKTCRTTCRSGVFQPSGSLGGASKSYFTSKCLPNGHWQSVSGTCQPAQAVACEKVPKIPLAVLNAAWPKGGCNNTAVGTTCASVCLDGYVAAAATTPMAVCNSTTIGPPQWMLLPATNATNITGCVADPCRNITCAGKCQLPGICDPATATCLPGSPIDCSEAFEMPSGSNITVTSTITTDTVSTTLRSADGVDLLRTNITPTALGIEFSPTGAQQKVKGSMNLTAEATAPSTYAANKLAVFLLTQLQEAWRLSGNTSDSNARKLLDSPGCDDVPAEVEFCCNLGCCAVHDECFRMHHCTSGSWRATIRDSILSPFGSRLDISQNPDSSPACILCNDAVVRCMLRCLGPWDSSNPLRGSNTCYGACPDDPSKAVYYNCPPKPGDLSDCNCDCPPPCRDCCTGTCIFETCCPDAQVICGRECCRPGEACAKGNICCPHARVCDDPACCPEGQACMGSLAGNKMCCPVGSSGICNGQCCNSGELCVEGNTRCCPTVNVCGDACGCPEGQICQQGRCVAPPDGWQPCGTNPQGCPPGKYCADTTLPVYGNYTGICCGRGETLCAIIDGNYGMAKCCAEGKVCMSGISELWYVPPIPGGLPGFGFGDIPHPVCCPRGYRWCGISGTYSGRCCASYQLCTDPDVARCCELNEEKKLVACHCYTRSPGQQDGTLYDC